MLSSKNVLAYISLLNDGNWHDVFEFIKMKKTFNHEEAEKVDSRISTDYVTLLDDKYPFSFKTKLTEPPFVLFYKGDLSLTSNRKYRRLAVVGSRECSKYGIEAVTKIIRGLPKDYVIVSGMALGIDAVAHKTAIECGLKTIAVLGSGIDYVYPAQNTALYNDIIANGGLIISEFPNNTQPKKDNFIFRNRLIASLGEFLLVGEAYKKSGTQTTISYALQCGNSVGCVPYQISDNSLCNRFIKEGAYLVESAEDVISLMNSEGESYK